MTECGTDVAAYALDSLSDAERLSFEHHLATCAVCGDELLAFDQVIVALAEGIPQQQVPPDLRRRVLAEVHQEAAASIRAESQRSRSLRRRLPAKRVRRPALALCAVLAAAAAVAAVAGILGSRSSPGRRAQVIQARVIGSSGFAQVRRASGHTELIVDRLPPPPSGEIYEVWLNRPGRPAQPTTALFNVTDAGDADVDVPGDLRHIVQIMVTPEPAGGTLVPTHPAVITASLT
jgi:anti-sigma factor RsiW